MVLVRAGVFLLGVLLVWAAVYSAVRTLVLPRSARDGLVILVFLIVRFFFNLPLGRMEDYRQRDRWLAYYAPVSLIFLLPAWLAVVMTGYTGMYWAAGGLSWYQAVRISGSSLLTLGSFTVDGLLLSLLEFSEATIGLILVALLISYLPSIYAAFQRREGAVTLLEVRAGNPPSPIEMIVRYHRIHGLQALSEMWRNWEMWFADVEESHTALPMLVFYRSPLAQHSWVTASGAVLDAAALVRSSVDVEQDPQADLCIRAGYLALRHIADFFHIAYNSNPRPGDPTSVSRSEYDRALERLAAGGVPLKADRDQAWRDFNGWRVNYDTVLLALADLTDAPESLWTGGRSKSYFIPALHRKHAAKF